jgi:uncharacterized protein
MNLPVLASPSKTDEPWFSRGLQFTCTQCGNCCSGGPGFVWISRPEITKLADFLKISRKELVGKYCRKVGRQLALKEIKHPRHGGYDCIFIKEIPADTSSGEGKVVHSKRICSVYEARPLQCRTWPFWEGNLASPRAWQRAARTCLGMNRGKTFDREKIEKLRDAKDWPENPPTSETA